MSFFTKAIFFFSALLLLSCSRGRERLVIDQIKSIFKVKWAEIKDSIIRNEQGELCTVKSIELSIEKLNPKYKREKVISSVAMIFYRGMKDLTYTRDSIKIILDANNLLSKVSYSVKDLSMIDTVISFSMGFITTLYGADKQNIRKFVDTSRFSLVDISNITSFLGKVKESFELLQLKCTGFLLTADKNTDEPILVLWIEQNNGNTVTYFTMYYSIEYGKVVYCKAEMG